MPITSRNAATVALLAVVLSISSETHAFVRSSSTSRSVGCDTCSTRSTGTSLSLSKGFGKPVGKGFGKSSSGGSNSNSGSGGSGNQRQGAASTTAATTGGPEKTYGKASQAPVDITIDLDAAMREFFTTNEEYHPLFRAMATTASVPAMDFMEGSHGGTIEFGENDPWTQLEAIPTGNEAALAVVAKFLDEVQRSLTEIPVTDSKEADANDIQFVEEGRRMLRISRFHVLPDVRPGCIDSHRTLFNTCWSELAELRRADDVDTGSVIILPDHDADDLRRFIDVNLQRPLEWLGISDLFEVVSLERDSPAIRLLHKLSDIPDEPYQPE